MLLLLPCLHWELHLRLVSAADNELSPEDKAAGWTLLFDGKTLDGWMRSDGKPSNRGVDHEAINPHRCGAYMMVYDKEFTNFELKCDYKVTPLCNSGIFVRTYPLKPRQGKDVGFNGIEIAIDDGIKEGYHATGAIYDLSPVLIDATKPTGQWNHIEITCDKSNITVDPQRQAGQFHRPRQIHRAEQAAQRHAAQIRRRLQIASAARLHRPAGPRFALLVQEHRAQAARLTVQAAGRADSLLGRHSRYLLTSLWCVAGWCPCS